MNRSKDKIWKDTEVSEGLNRWKERGQTIVFTNGCFDILHSGHLDYLERARSLGDRLIIGLNTDESVRRLKGTERPINPLAERALMLASLMFVDAVIPFADDTPYELVSHIKPDILVKGGDYLAENIVGADIVMSYGGKVEVLPFIDGFSTTSIIERIRNLNR